MPRLLLLLELQLLMNLLLRKSSRLCRHRGPPELLSRRLLLPEAPSGQTNPRKQTLLLKLTDPLPPPMMSVNTLDLLSLYNLYSYASLFC
jgi:hypothetical protein